MIDEGMKPDDPNATRLNGAACILLLFGWFIGLLSGITLAGYLAWRIQTSDLDGYTRTGLMMHNGRAYTVLPAGDR